MLYARVNLTVREDRTYSDRKIMLYRGDNNVDIEFNLTSYDYIIEDSKYVQAILTRPYAPSIFSDLFELNENKFTLTITGDMIDELTELEMYTMQLILFDEVQEDKVTLPPCYDIFDIKKPLATEAARINWAAVNYDTVAVEEENFDDTAFEGDEYLATNWRDGDIISDVRLNKIENALTVIAHKAGSGTGVSSVYISSDAPEVLVLNKDSDLALPLKFISPNPGRGMLTVAINNVTAFTTSLAQGSSTVYIPEKIFSKGSNIMTIYAMDRTGGMSNTIMFEVRYGSLEFKSDFDSYSAYDVGSQVRYYFTPTCADTSLALTFYMEIDGVLQNGVSCVSDTRQYFTFPTNLGKGCHKCKAYIVDENGNMSANSKFNFVLLDETGLVVASDITETVVEEGSQLKLDYKVYMKNNLTFITKVYVDNNLVNTGTCGLEMSYYKTSSLTEGDHTIRLEVFNQSQSVSDSITWAVTVTASTYTMIEPLNAGLMFSATAYNKTNSDEGKENWVGLDQEGNQIIAPLTNFSFNSESGWVDDTLIVSGSSHVEIPLKPLLDNASSGFTLDIEFLSKHIGIEDAEVLNIWDNTRNCGIKITTENIILRSAAGNECNLYFSDNQFTNAIFVIDRNEKKAKIYLNGVMCHAFHLSDYVANGVTYLEDFSVNANVVLGGKNKNGYSKFKNIRIYNVALTTQEILNNFISNERIKEKQQALVDFQKGNELPTLTIYGDFSGLGKDDKKPCKIVYNSTDELKYGKSFILDHKASLLQYQGTSSMAYPIKNYRINLRNEDGTKLYYQFPNGQPETRLCLKADFMSSGHWQNTGFTKWVNDNLYDYNINNEKSMNPKKWFDIHNGGKLTDTRECIYGFPCRLILVNDGITPLNEGQNEPSPGNTKDMGIFNFNHDKDCTATMGFDQANFPNCASFEVAANSDTSAGAFMSYGKIKPSGKTELEYLKDSFEMRFPDEDDVEDGWGFMGTGEEGTGIKALVDWVDNSSDEEFVRDFEQHFNKDYTLRYFLMVMVCGMVDNLGKNMMLDTWDNKIWMPRFYDCDTICSYDNSGDIRFDVDIEMEQGYWNTSNSRLWTRIRDLMHNDLVSKYNSMRKNGLSYESLMQCFYDEQISKIPQKYYNMDFDIKYAPFGDSYMGMAHGDGYEHLKHWLKRRITFCDTLYDYAPSYNNDVLTIRANTTNPMTLELETFTPVYQHLSWYNGQMDKKKVDGKTAVTFTGTAMAATDQEVLIYGGSNIKKIKGIKTMNPNQMLIGYATKLSEIDASNCPLLADINSDGANLSPHIYINSVDLSNCIELSGTLRLNNSQLIRYIDITNTNINNIIFPTNLRNLETLKLCETVSNVTLRDAAMLEEMNIPANIEYLSLINVPSLSTITSSSTSYNNLKTLIMENPKINPISNITSKAPNMTHVRLTGLDISCSTPQIQSLLSMKGVDSFGNEIPVAQAVSGKITLSQCSTDIEQALRSSFPLVEFMVSSYVQSHTVTFVDGDGNTIYVTQALTNGEAVYAGPTPTKTSTAKYHYTWKGWDRQLKPITSDTTIKATFTSVLRYYTVRFINSETMEVVQESSLGYGSTITKPDLPEGSNLWSPIVTTVTGDVDFYSKYLPYPEDLSIFNFTINSSDGTYTVSLTTSGTKPSYVIYPFEYRGKAVTRIYQSSSNGTYAANITEVYIPETITKIDSGAFSYFKSLKEIILPENADWNVDGTYEIFYGCTKLEKVIAPGVTGLPSTDSTSKKGIFRECTSLKLVQLGSSSRPFVRWYEDSASSSYHHFYGINANLIINLVTKNGLLSDVNFNNYDNITTFVKDSIITSKSDIEEYADDSGFKYLLADSEAIVYEYSGSLSEVQIPTTVKDIPTTRLYRRAFNNNATITSVSGPSVRLVDGYCFYQCTKLATLSLPSLTSISDYAFTNCTSLTTADFPLVNTLGSYVFHGCSKLESVNMPKITTLKNSAFYKCSVLREVDFPLVTEVGSECFYTCYNLTSVNLPAATTFGSHSFYYCHKLLEISLPLATKLGDYCFASCIELVRIDLPLVTILGNYIFNNCTSLETINIPSVTELRSSTFRYCESIVTLDLPSATILGDYALNSCKKLESVNMPLVNKIGVECFRYCEALDSITMPSIVTIYINAFYNIKNPSTATIGSIGKPITDTSNFHTAALSSYITTINIYVEDPSNPPTLTGSPWGASNATINYLQA